MCEKCLYRGNCQFLASNKKSVVESCTAFKSESEVRAEVIEEYRKKVYAKMGKYTVFGREYIQRIMREVEKELKGGAE